MKFYRCDGLAFGFPCQATRDPGHDHEGWVSCGRRDRRGRRELFNFCPKHGELDRLFPNDARPWGIDAEMLATALCKINHKGDTHV